MFRNLTIYHLAHDWRISHDTLVEQLSRGLFAPCTPNQPVSRGWLADTAQPDTVRTHLVGNGSTVIHLITEQRILPAAAVDAEVQKRANVFAEEQGYAPGRKMLRELKERVVEEFMPRAFTSQTATAVLIDRVNGWFGIDTATPGKADAVVDQLRCCLDDFPLAAVITNTSPASAMADWLASGEAPDGFTIDRDCELKSVGGEKSTVRYARHPLNDEMHDEIKAHLSTGKMPSLLALTWDERVSFVLTDRGILKRIAILDVAAEDVDPEADDVGGSLALFTGEMARLLPALVNALGGEYTGADLS